MKTLFKTDEQYNLSPLRYPWSFEMYKAARKNFWNPEQIKMGQDVAQFASLTDSERQMFLDVFATLTTADLAIQENLASRIYDILTPPEIRLFLSHQMADESLHSYSYQHIIECLALDDASIYQRYQQRPYILQKFKFGNEYAQKILSDDPIERITGLAFFYLGWEGIWFYHGFSPILRLGQMGKMTGTAEQLLYIARDEVTHFQFGLRLIQELLDEHRAHAQAAEPIRQMFSRLTLAESDYAAHAIPELAGYNPRLHIEHTRYLVNLRLEQIGLQPLFPLHAAQPLPWLSEMLELKKEKNFFEGHVTEYQSGSALDFGDPTPMEQLMEAWG